MTFSERVAAGALDWLVANLPRFDRVPRGTTPDETSQTALAELAMAVHQMRRRSGADPRLARCLDLLETVYRDPALHEFPFRREPRALAGHALIWLALRERGIEALVGRERFQQAVDAGGILPDPREPYRALELRYVLDLAGLRHGMPPAGELFARTVLGGDLDALSADEATAYAVTHTLFFATDYGLARPAYLHARRDAVLALLRRLLQAALDAEHRDLVGELILCHRSLTRDHEPLVQEGWRALAASQDPDGMIRHPASLLRRLAELPAGEPRAEYLFLRCHHMTLVTVMAGFLGVPEDQEGRA